MHPQTKGYAIGGEDGYVRLHHFDDDFLQAKPCECERLTLERTAFRCHTD